MFEVYCCQTGQSAERMSGLSVCCHSWYDEGGESVLTIIIVHTDWVSHLELHAVVDSLIPRGHRVLLLGARERGKHGSACHLCLHRDRKAVSNSGTHGAENTRTCT